MILFQTFGVFMIATLLGVPLVYGLLLSTAGMIWYQGLGHPLTSVFLSYIGGVEPFVLIAVPLFMLAGEILSRGGVGMRIVTFATKLLGFLPGGLGIATTTSCLIFGGVSGSAIADTRRDRLGDGARDGEEGLPAGLRRRADVDRRHARGRDAAVDPDAGLRVRLGRVGARSVHRGCRASRDLRDRPVARLRARRPQDRLRQRRRPRTDARDLDRFSGRVPLRFLMPVIILGGIWSGYFTPTEAAAVAAAYGLFVSMVVYRDLKPRDLPALLLKSFTTSAVVMVVIGATACLAWLITVEQVPVQIAALVTEYATSQWMFLLMVNVAMLALGCFIEPVPALILAAPLLVPLASAFRIDPVHLGLIMTCNLAIGLYTPPVGGTLMVGARLAGRRHGVGGACAAAADGDQRLHPARDHLCAVDQHGAGPRFQIATFMPVGPRGVVDVCRHR